MKIKITIHLEKNTFLNWRIKAKIMTIAEKTHQAKKVNYEFQLWPTYGIICNADDQMFYIPYEKEEFKLEWLNEYYPDEANHHSEIDDHTVITDKDFLKDQFNKYIYLAEEIEI
jgi:hypothetical protein